MLLTNRKNVIGTGADRRDLPNYKTFPFQNLTFSNQVLDLVEALPKDYNDIQSEQSYQIASKSPLKEYFPNRYRQILLQHKRDDTTGENETDYTVDMYPEIMDTIKQIFPKCYRARIAILVAGDELGMHIDSNTSVSCRFHIPIYGACRWTMRREGVEHQFIMQPPGIWFVNAGYPHKVENCAPVERITVALGCHYDDVTNFLPKLSPGESYLGSASTI
jgi:hypothetical protein